MSSLRTCSTRHHRSLNAFLWTPWTSFYAFFRRVLWNDFVTIIFRQGQYILTHCDSFCCLELISSKYWIYCQLLLF
jgi:hypothetical protein